jgi:hypothetical protein
VAQAHGALGREVALAEVKDDFLGTRLAEDRDIIITRPESPLALIGFETRTIGSNTGDGSSSDW